MKPTTIACLVLAVCALPTAAHSQFATPESAIKYRQGAFSVMAAHFSRVAMMAQGIQPFDAKAAQENVELVGNLAKLPFTAFGAGTDKGAAHRAKDDVWKDAPKFKAAVDRMLGDVSKMEQAAKSGDFEALRSAVGMVGRSCKSCHDDFRGAKRGE